MTIAPRFNNIRPATTLRKIHWSIRAVPLSQRFDSGSLAHLAVLVIMLVAFFRGDIAIDQRTFVGACLLFASVGWFGVQAGHSWLVWSSFVHTVNFRKERQRHLRFVQEVHAKGHVSDDQLAEVQRILSSGSRVIGPALTSLSHDERIAYEQGQAEGRAHYAARMK